MEQFIINIKDENKLQEFLEVIQKMDFVEVLKANKIENPVQDKNDEYNFFNSAGLWKDRNIDADHLRKSAWKKNH